MTLSALIVIAFEPATAPLSFASTEPATIAWVSTMPAEIPPTEAPKTRVSA